MTTPDFHIYKLDELGNNPFHTIASQHDLVLFPADCIAAGRVRGSDKYKKFYHNLTWYTNYEDIYKSRREHPKQKGKALFQDTHITGTIKVLSSNVQSNDKADSQSLWSDDTPDVIALFCRYTYNDSINYTYLQECIEKVKVYMNECGVEYRSPCIIY